MSPHRHREMKGTSDVISPTSDEALWKESIKEEPPSWQIKDKNSRSLGCRRLPPFLLCLGLRCLGLALRPPFGREFEQEGSDSSRLFESGLLQPGRATSNLTAL